MPNTLSVTAAVTAPPAPDSVVPEAPPEGYLGRAFLLQYNLILLGGAMLFALAFASFAPLVTGAVGEFVWLLVAPRSVAFRRWVDHRSSVERLAHVENEIRAVLAPLEPAYAARQLALSRQAVEIVKLVSEQRGVHGAELDILREKLAEVGFAFSRFAAIDERLSKFVSETPVNDIEQEILRTREQLTAAKDLGVRVTVRQSLVLAERRRAQRQQIGNTRRAVEVQLDTLEKSFAYIRSRALGLATVTEVHRDIDALLGQVRSVSAIEAETHEATKVA